MELLKTVLTPALVSGLMFYLLKRWDETRKRNFDVRYAEYKKYLQTLEEITASTRVDFKTTFQQIMSDLFRSTMNDPNSANAALMKMQSSLSPLMDGLRESFTKASNELHGLRLVCSDKLLNLIDELVKLQSENLQESGKLMEGWITSGIHAKPQSEIPDEMKKKGLRSQQLFNEIVIQMRKELGIK